MRRLRGCVMRPGGQRAGPDTTLSALRNRPIAGASERAWYSSKPALSSRWPVSFGVICGTPPARTLPHGANTCQRRRPPVLSVVALTPQP
jgi:hypothetical protein